jgi:hypothetical protein
MLPLPYRWSERGTAHTALSWCAIPVLYPVSLGMEPVVFTFYHKVMGLTAFLMPRPLRLAHRVFTVGAWAGLSSGTLCLDPFSGAGAFSSTSAFL